MIYLYIFKNILYIKISPYSIKHNKQSSLPELEDVLLSGNPLEEKCTAEGTWRDEFTKKFTQVKKLDGKPIIREEEGEEEES